MNERPGDGWWVVYRLHIAPGENDSDGKDFDEWFSSLRKARARRAQLIAENPTLVDHRLGADYAIDLVRVGKVATMTLILQLLNGRGYMSGVQRKQVEYRPKAKTKAEEL
jgi:hypothetical protein